MCCVHLLLCTCAASRVPSRAMSLRFVISQVLSYTRLLTSPDVDAQRATLLRSCQALLSVLAALHARSGKLLARLTGVDGATLGSSKLLDHCWNEARRAAANYGSSLRSVPVFDLEGGQEALPKASVPSLLTARERLQRRSNFGTDAAQPSHGPSSNGELDTATGGGGLEELAPSAISCAVPHSMESEGEDSRAPSTAQLRDAAYVGHAAMIQRALFAAGSAAPPPSELQAVLGPESQLQLGPLGVVCSSAAAAPDGTP